MKKKKNLSNLGTGLTEQTRQKWHHKIEMLSEPKYRRHLTEWERSLLESARGRLEVRGRDLTMRQSIALNKMYNKVLRLEIF